MTACVAGSYCLAVDITTTRTTSTGVIVGVVVGINIIILCVIASALFYYYGCCGFCLGCPCPCCLRKKKKVSPIIGARAGATGLPTISVV